MKKNEKFSFFWQIWGFIRENMILLKHRKVADFWNPVIRAYFEGKIEKNYFTPLKEFPEEKRIIWQYWGQGVDQIALPEVVRDCFTSVDKYKGEYEVMRLCDDTVEDYITLPDFIWEKRKNGQLSVTFFSDLLRLVLLHTYGGVWLDATILLTGTLPEEYTGLDYFVFQRDNNEENRSKVESPISRYWGWKLGFKVKMLNSIIFAKKNNEVIQVLMDLLLYYWKTEKEAVAYFFFQILYYELMNNYIPDKRCPVVSDFTPHLLQAKLLDPSTFSSLSFQDILQESCMHKMTYYKDDAAERFCSFINEFMG